MTAIGVGPATVALDAPILVPVGVFIAVHDVIATVNLLIFATLASANPARGPITSAMFLPPQHVVVSAVADLPTQLPMLLTANATCFRTQGTMMVRSPLHVATRGKLTVFHLGGPSRRLLRSPRGLLSLHGKLLRRFLLQPSNEDVRGSGALLTVWIPCCLLRPLVLWLRCSGGRWISTTLPACVAAKVAFPASVALATERLSACKTGRCHVSVLGISCGIPVHR